jgi:hypothetical protein
MFIRSLILKSVIKNQRPDSIVLFVTNPFDFAGKRRL